MANGILKKDELSSLKSVLGINDAVDPIPTIWQTSPNKQPSTNIIWGNSVPPSNLLLSVGSPVAAIEPYVIESIDGMENTKVSNKNPSFTHGKFIDDIFEGFGGVLELMKVTWDDGIKEGEVCVLMKDWRVISIFIKTDEFVGMTDDQIETKINADCMVFEDMDEWSHWYEADGGRMEREKKKVSMIKQNAEEEKRNALIDFFSGKTESIEKLMSNAVSNTTNDVDKNGVLVPF